MAKIYIHSILCFLLIMTFGHAQEATCPPSPDCNDCRYENPGRIRVVIDPGHGGHDSGAQAGGVDEKEINLQVSLLLGEQLQKLGYEVIFTRKTDQFVSLSQRAKLVNRVKADVFISIHANSAEHPSARGFEIWCRKGKDPESIQLAGLIQKAVLAKIPTLDRGVKSHKSLYVLSQTYCPAGLVELGFVTNPGDRKRMIDPVMQKKYAVTIARGIKEFLDARSPGKKRGMVLIQPTPIRYVLSEKRSKKKINLFDRLRK